MGDIKTDKIGQPQKKVLTLEEMEELVDQGRKERANNPNLSEEERERARTALALADQPLMVIPE